MNDPVTANAVEITPATPEQQPVLSNLYQLYIHDFTDFVPQTLSDDGRFDYNPLPAYWTEPDRYPFLVWADGKLAGFALVKKSTDFSGNADVWDMADFFIVRGMRGKGVGLQVAEAIWRQFPGPWEVRVMPNNMSARKFWASAISTYLGKLTRSHLVINGEEARYLFFFDSKSNPLDDPQ